MTSSVTLSEAISSCINYSFVCANSHVEKAANHKTSGYSLFRSMQHKRLNKRIPDFMIRSKKVVDMWQASESIRSEYNDLVMDTTPRTPYFMYCKTKREKHKDQTITDETLKNQGSAASDKTKQKYIDGVRKYNSYYSLK
jgi:hypothetical protein